MIPFLLSYFKSTLTRNIRTRRQGRVSIKMPLFQDLHTAKHAISRIQKEYQERASYFNKISDSPSTLTEHDASRHGQRWLHEVSHDKSKAFEHELDETKWIYMDAMGFGMGCCCLQVTFQAQNCHEARRLYDHLAVFAPIMVLLNFTNYVYLVGVNSCNTIFERTYS
jgi:glutamate--cysteine ligase catalytic subunit